MAYEGTVRGEELLNYARTPIGKRYIDTAIDIMIETASVSRDQAFAIIAEKGRVSVDDLKNAYKNGGGLPTPPPH